MQHFACNILHKKFFYVLSFSRKIRIIKDTYNLAIMFFERGICLLKKYRKINSLSFLIFLIIQNKLKQASSYLLKYVKVFQKVFQI